MFKLGKVSHSIRLCKVSFPSSMLLGASGRNGSEKNLALTLPSNLTVMSMKIHWKSNSILKRIDTVNSNFNSRISNCQCLA